MQVLRRDTLFGLMEGGLLDDTSSQRSMVARRGCRVGHMNSESIACKLLASCKLSCKACCGLEGANHVNLSLPAGVALGCAIGFHGSHSLLQFEQLLSLLQPPLRR